MQKVAFRKCKVILLHENKSSYNIILLINENKIILIKTKCHIFTNTSLRIILFFFLMKLNIVNIIKLK